jgi:hypothetical protein
MGEEFSVYEGIVCVVAAAEHFKVVPTVQIVPFATAHVAVTAFSGAKVQKLIGSVGGSCIPAPSQYKHPWELHSENSCFDHLGR